MRERHLPVPREAAWAALLAVLGRDDGDLSVEAPWRHVRRRTVPGVDHCEQTVTLRDDGDECHAAWCAGLAAPAEDAGAGAALDGLAAEGESLLADLAERCSS